MLAKAFRATFRQSRNEPAELLNFPKAQSCS